MLPGTGPVPASHSVPVPRAGYRTVVCVVVRSLIMTQGGPAEATQVVGTLMYQEAFQDQAAGYASAMGLTLGFISVCVVIIYIRLRRRGWNV